MATRPGAPGCYDTVSVTTVLRFLLRRLTGPLVRRSLVVLLVVVAWVGWAYLPPRPLADWTATDVHPALAASADGLIVACASSRGLSPPPPHLQVDDWPGRAFNLSPVRVFDVVAGRERCRLDIEPYEHGVQLSPDGRWLAIEDQRRAGSIWDTSTGRLVVASDALPHAFGLPVLFLPGGDRCLLNGRYRGGDSTLWDLAAGRALATLEYAGLPAVLTPDGQTLITIGYEAVRFWDAATGRPKLTQRLAAAIEDWSLGVAVAPDGRRLAVVARRPLPPPPGAGAPAIQVLLFDLADGTVMGAIPLPDQSDTHIWFSPDGRWLLIGRLTAAAVWDVAARPPRDATPAALRRHPYRNSRLCREPLWDDRPCLFGPAGAAVVVDCDAPGTLDLIDLATHARRAKFRVPGDPADYAAVRSSPDGRILAVQAVLERPVPPSDLREWIDRLLGRPAATALESVVHLFDTSTGRARAVVSTGQTHEPALVTFAPDGRSVWTVEATLDGVLTARQWAVPTGWPAVWVLGVTVAGLLLVIADRRRGWRRRVATISSA